jgi:hypothetical protein
MPTVKPPRLSFPNSVLIKRFTCAYLITRLLCGCDREEEYATNGTDKTINAQPTKVPAVDKRGPQAVPCRGSPHGRESFRLGYRFCEQALVRHLAGLGSFDLHKLESTHRSLSSSIRFSRMFAMRRARHRRRHHNEYTNHRSVPAEARISARLHQFAMPASKSPSEGKAR